MLKIKKSDKLSEKKQKAMKEVLKEERVAMYGYTSEKLHRKLKKYLFENGISYTQWLSEKIEEI